MYNMLYNELLYNHRKEETMLEFFVDMWQSGTRNKIMLIAGALIFLGAIVGVIYGVCS